MKNVGDNEFFRLLNQYIVKFSTPKTMNIGKLSNLQLITYFKDAVCDNNYNPSSKPYNKSGFTYDELETEIFNRLPKENDDDDDDEYEDY